MENKLGINLKENNIAWLSLWALVPSKVIKNKLVKAEEYGLISSFDKKVSKREKNVKPKRDLIKLIESQDKFVIDKARNLLKEIETYSTELKEKNQNNIDKPIILSGDDLNGLNITLIRTDTYVYQTRIIISNTDYEWNTDIDFNYFKNYIIDVGDEDEELDPNQEIYIKLKCKNFVGAVSFYSYGIGEGEFNISWQEDEHIILNELTDVIKQLSTMIYKTSC